MSLPQYNIDRDRKVKVLKDDAAVSASLSESVYAKYLNFKGTNFTVAENNTLGSYDITLSGIPPANKLIPKLNNVQVASTARNLNFDNTNFNITENVGNDNYDFSLKYPGRVITLDDAVAVNTTPRKLNFSSGLTATENVGTDSIDLTATSVSPVTGVKWGVVMGGAPSAATVGSGLCNNWKATALTSGNVSNGIDTDGSYLSLNTTSTSQTNAEINSTNNTGIRGDLSFKIWTKVKIPNVNNNRWFIGVTDDVGLPENTFNFLNNQYGFGLRYDTTTDTTLKLINNNNAASQTVTDTLITPVNNTVYNIYIEYTSAPQMKLIINGTTFTKTTAIPTSTTTLGWLQRMQTSTGSVRNQFVYYIYVETAK